MVPIDITKILTAAAPIVASVASMANKNKPEVIVENKEDGKPATININITNKFYVNTEEEAVSIASKVQKDIVNRISCSDSHYIL